MILRHAWRPLAAAALLLAAQAASRADVVDFDSDVDQRPEWGGLGWTYQFSHGFDWGSPGWAIVSDEFMAPYGNSFDSPSGQNAVFNGGTGDPMSTLTVRRESGAIDFQGLNVATWGREDAMAGFSATQLTVEGYNGQTLVGSLSVGLSATGYQWVNANFQGVTELRFSVEPGKYWLLDDLTYQPSTVPEPSTALMSALGLLGMGLFIARRRRAGGDAG